MGRTEVTSCDGSVGPVARGILQRLTCDTIATVRHPARVAFAAVVLLASGAHGDGDGWVTFKKTGSAEYERRAVPGSRYYEYRGRALVALPLPALTTLIWAAITDHTPATVQRRVVLAHSDDEFVVYDQIHVPVIRDRDVAIRIHKTVSANATTIAFANANELAPPSTNGRVRLPVVRGAWRLTTATGGTLLEYSCYSEPGGSVPAFVVRGSQADEIVLDVERILSLTRAR